MKLINYYEKKIEPALSRAADIFGYIVIAGGILLIIRMLVEMAALK